MSFRKALPIISNACFTALLLSAASLFAQTPSFTAFDAPDAGTGEGQGTFAISINDKGIIAGYYVDSANHSHGFIRQANGAITEFDPPGMTDIQSTAINGRNQIIGYGTSNHDTTQGFQRSTHANPWLHIVAPGSMITFPMSNNDNGFITGWWEGAAFDSHGFVFDPMVGYTTFDDPDAGFQLFDYGTHATAINNSGTIAGFYDDKDVEGLLHVFVRDPLGNITHFDAEGTGSGRLWPVHINTSGEIAGYYQNPGAQLRSFFRDGSGNVTDFDVTGADSTTAAGMNDAGTIVGSWVVGVSEKGFIRKVDGSITTFSVPGTILGTRATAVNNSNRITGYFFTNSAARGFVR